MKSVQDALYNYLSILVVFEDRPDDTAAEETVHLFLDMLRDDHGVSDVRYETDDVMYYVTYVQHDEEKKTRFPIELIDVMRNQMQDEPDKYVNYPE